MTRHFERDELLAYLDGNDAIVDLVEVADHVAKCAACRERLEEVSADYAFITDVLVWRDPDRHHPPEDRVAAFVATREKLAREAARAEEVVEMFGAATPKEWDAFLASSPTDATEGLVRRLVAFARDEEERDACRATTILDAAEAVAIRAGLEPRTHSDALGDLWKERANVWMIRGDFPRAAAAIDAAETIYTAQPIAEFNLAFTTWLRATLCFETGAYAAGVPLAERAAAVFRQFGDETREIHVRILIASILYEQGQVADAETRFLGLLFPVKRLGDRVTEARLLANLACCCLFRDDFAMMADYAERAAAIYREFDRETEIIRLRWALGVVYLRRGESERGITALTDIVKAFSERGLTSAAAEAELQIAEELLRRKDFASAAAIAGRLATMFADIDARLSAATAFAYLREATLTEEATPELFRAVRHVLTYPEQPFTPPEDTRIQ